MSYDTSVFKMRKICEFGCV